MNSSSDEKALGVVGIRSLRERQRGVAETDLITVKESEWERLHAELARTNQVIEDIRARCLQIDDVCVYGERNSAYQAGAHLLAHRVLEALSGLSEHQEGNSNG